MNTQIILPAQLVHIPTNEKFILKNNSIYQVANDIHINVGTIYKYTRKGFYYLDFFAKKSYITWAEFQNITHNNDDNLPNQLPLFPDTEQI